MSEELNLVGEPEWLISVDDHVIEPGTVWTDRLPAKYKDVGPRLIDEGQGEAWVYEGVRVPTTGLMAVVGKEKDDWEPTEVTLSDLKPGVYDAKERAKDMDQAGILSQTLFPSYPRFCGQIFKEAKDKDLSLLCVKAWNDYVIDEWYEEVPGRFVPLAMVPLWDANLAAAEATRAIERGARGILFSENAAALGLPSIHDSNGYWDPLLSVANETGLPICMHIGSSSKIPSTAEDAPAIMAFVLTPLNALSTLIDWTFSGNFFRFPNLKIMLSEGEIGWIPFVLQWMDHAADTQRWAWSSDASFDFLGGSLEKVEKRIERIVVDPDFPPSALFKKHVSGCFIDDVVGVRNIDLVGVDNVMIETDYPHSDGTWPNSLSVAREQLSGLSVEDRQKIMLSNACRIFDFYPDQLKAKV